MTTIPGMVMLKYCHTTNTRVQNGSLENKAHLPTASRGARGNPGLWSHPDSVRTHLMSLIGSGGRVEGTPRRTQEGVQEEPYDRRLHTGAHSLHAFFLLPKLLVIEAEVVNEGRGHALHLEIHEGLQGGWDAVRVVGEARWGRTHQHGLPAAARPPQGS